MNFGGSEWLWLLLLVPVLGWLFFRRDRLASALVSKLVATRLAPRLVATVNRRIRRVIRVLQVGGVALVVLALAGPEWGFTYSEDRRVGLDVVVVVDVSRSMLATDLAPNRLANARLAVRDLIDRLTGDRIGLVAFAGKAFLQAPLTTDRRALAESVNQLDPDLIPRGGTNIAMGIDEALGALEVSEGRDRAMVLFSDGEELEADALRAARQAAAEGVYIYTVGIGSPEGSVIKVEDQYGRVDYARHSDGELVISKLDEERLKEIADITGGFYTPFTTARATADRVVDEGLSRLAAGEIEVRESQVPINRYQWPLGVGILMIMISMVLPERRREPPMRRVGTSAVALLALMWFNVEAAASSADRLYEEGRYAEAAEAYRERLERAADLAPRDRLHYNAGSAFYKSGQYEDAFQEFGQALITEDPELRTQAHYNLGNTLFRLGGMAEEAGDFETTRQLWTEAIEQYDDALVENPDHEDAEFNREVVRRRLEELEEPPPEEEDQEDQDDQEDSEDDEEGEDDQDEGDDDQEQDEGDDEQEEQDDGDDSEDDSEDEGEPDSDQDEDQDGEQDGDDEQDGDMDGEQDGENDAGEDPEDRDTEGELGQDPDDGPPEQPEPQPGEEPVGPEEMSPEEAAAILDAMADEEDSVQLWDLQDERTDYKDW